MEIAEPASQQVATNRGLWERHPRPQPTTNIYISSTFQLPLLDLSTTGTTTSHRSMSSETLLVIPSTGGFEPLGCCEGCPSHTLRAGQARQLDKCVSLSARLTQSPRSL